MEGSRTVYHSLCYCPIIASVCYEVICRINITLDTSHTFTIMHLTVGCLPEHLKQLMSYWTWLGEGLYDHKTHYPVKLKAQEDASDEEMAARDAGTGGTQKIFP